MTTEEHLAKSGWWPRKGEAQKGEYVGAATCAECHSTFGKQQQQHAMAHSAARVAELTSPQHSTDVALGHAHYSIAADGESLTYSVQWDGQAFSAPLEWVFGSGRHGQTYLYRRNGEWWETHITLFNAIGPDVTPGESDAPPASLTEASGRPITGNELPECFSCHAVASITGGQFNPALATPGISCEGCHGPGAAHVAVARSGLTANPGLIFNAARLDPVNSVDFCGSCHRTWWDVSQMNNPGIKVVRFPAYRLEQSRCWGNGDARITCYACHDPHKPLAREASEYDQRCLSCHVKSAALRASVDHPGAGCPVKSSNCTSCHMPKYELPQTHARFTDHRIRIVKDPGSVPSHWD